MNNVSFNQEVLKLILFSGLYEQQLKEIFTEDLTYLLYIMSLSGDKPDKSGDVEKAEEGLTYTSDRY